MGKDISADLDPKAIRSFTRAILVDLRALERILDEGLIEAETRRMGAEQELFLVNAAWRPAPVSMEVLERLDGPDFTTELARFNLEINLQPVVLGGDCFTVLENRLRDRLAQVREAAREEGAEPLLTGILPTLGKSDLSLENITPRPRYYALNEAVMRMRGGPARLKIEGIDELNVEHESVMLEACNESFQVHLQVSASEFATYYNVAQALLGPVLAAAVNSPLLFGRRLWAETRIALFQQSVDTRSTMPHLRERSPRVRFGESWVDESVLELFHDDVSRFRVLIAAEVGEDPFERLDRGETPALQALQLHNSTVYRWNRPCYGVSDGRPHLRIECRALPSGPSVRDEIANAAFWIGSVIGAAAEFDDIRKALSFEDAKGNFLAAARHGLNTAFTWVKEETHSAADLILSRLIPLARQGLQLAEVDADDIDRYLGVIEARVEAGSTGAQWILRSLAGFSDDGTRAERLAAVTAGIATRQHEDKPVHEWSLARLSEAGGWRDNYLRVEQYMTTELFTVHEDELVDLVAFLMDRHQLRQVLVEDDEHRIVGLVSYRSLVRLLTRSERKGAAGMVPVSKVMARDPITIPPETPTIEAIELMRENRVSCLPVVKNGKLVGIVSERDFMPIARQLLHERLKEE